MSVLVTQVRNFIDSHVAGNYVLAYSGGLDSTALVHVMKGLFDQANHSKLEAVHVNHNLHKDSLNWVQICKDNCHLLDIQLTVHNIYLDLHSGESLEAQARDLRYACLYKHVSMGSVVLTAHHQDDQAETLLLQLMRGSGPTGLSSMPVIKPFSQGRLGRPFLGVSRADILSYAKHYALRWIDDPSNLETDYDRNYIRQKLFPVLQSRWPSAAKVMARSAGQCASMTDALRDLAQDRLQQCVGSASHALSCSQLKRQSRATAQVLIRCWLEQQNVLMPSSKQLQQIINNVVNSNVDATPCVCLGNHEIRRHKNDLLIEKRLPEFEHLQSTITPQDTCAVPGLGEFYFEKSIGQGFDWPENGTKVLQIRYRQGGEICRPLRRTHQHKLKKILQELSVPSWQRSRLPLLYDGSKIIAVADLLVCEPYGVTDNDSGYQLKRRQVK